MLEWPVLHTLHEILNRLMLAPYSKQRSVTVLLNLKRPLKRPSRETEKEEKRLYEEATSRGQYYEDFFDYFQIDSCCSCEYATRSRVLGKIGSSQRRSAVVAEHARQLACVSSQPGSSLPQDKGHKNQVNL